MFFMHIIILFSPPLRREVGALGDVEPVVEPRVVRVREDDDDGALLLHHLLERDAMRLHHGRLGGRRKTCK